MPSFFGLNESNRVVILNEFYFLMKLLNISYSDLRHMPIVQRRWFIDRTIQDQRVAQPIDPNYGVDTDTPLSSVRSNR